MKLYIPELLHLINICIMLDVYMVCMYVGPFVLLHDRSEVSQLLLLLMLKACAANVKCHILNRVHLGHSVTMATIFSVDPPSLTAG